MSTLRGLLDLFPLDIPCQGMSQETHIFNYTCLPYQVFITVLPAKSDSGVMFCSKGHQEVIIDRSIMY